MKILALLLVGLGFLFAVGVEDPNEVRSIGNIIGWSLFGFFMIGIGVLVLKSTKNKKMYFDYSSVNRSV
jgi:hypothetical protein